MARSLPAKDPNDILDYQVDWSRRLDPGDTISTATFSLTTAAGLTISSSSKTDTTATVWLTGGHCLVNRSDPVPGRHHGGPADGL